MKTGIYMGMMMVLFAFMFLLGAAVYKNNEEILIRFFHKRKQGESSYIVHFFKTTGGLLLLLTGLFLFSRLFMLAEVPRGIHVDEAGMAYDAFCLARYGVDRYLYRFPVYFNNYFGGQSVLYGYLCALLMKLMNNWDFNLLLIRTPAVLGSLCTVISAYGIGKCLIEKRSFGLLCAFLTIVSPYFIMAGRWGLDCNLMLPLFSLGLWMMCLALKKSKLIYYLASAFFFGVCLYTYALSWMMVPIFLIISIIYLIRVKSLRLGYIVLSGILLMGLALPLILFFAVNQGWMDEILLDWISIYRLYYFRGSEISLFNILDNLNLFKTLMTADFLPYNSFDFFGTLYLFSIPFVIYGLVFSLFRMIQSLRKKELDCISLVFIACISIYVSGLLIVGPNINKLNAIYISLVIFTAKGIWDCIRTFKASFNWILGAYLVSFVLFSYYYFGIYPTESYPQYLFDDTTYPALVELKEGWKIDETLVYTDVNMERCGYIFVLMANQIDPNSIDSLAYTLNKQIRQFQFHVPDQIDTNALYFLRKETLDESVHQHLIEAGYSVKETQNGKYQIYYFENQKY